MKDVEPVFWGKSATDKVPNIAIFKCLSCGGQAEGLYNGHLSCFKCVPKVPPNTQKDSE